MTQYPYDAIVVGSGSTGGVAALTLAQRGFKVLVIEAGPELSISKAFGSEPDNTFRRLQGIISGEKKVQSQHPGYWKANPLLYINEKKNPYTCPPDKPYFWTQGKQLGGRSLTWGGITLRLSQGDLKASRLDGYGPEWPIDYKELSPHYSELEKLLGIHGNKDKLKQLPDGEYIRPLPFTQAEKYISEKVINEMGYPFIHSRGFGPYESNGYQWPKSSSLGTTLKLALKTGRVELLTNNVVERFIMHPDKQKAKAVVVVNQNDGKRQLIESSLLVLCASTIQTNKILLNSEKHNTGEGFKDNSFKLGSNLMDHISVCRFFSLPYKENSKQLNTEVEKQSLSGAGSFFIPFGTELENTGTINFLRGYGIWGGVDRFDPPKYLKKNPDSNIGFLIGHGEVLPSNQNNVSLSSKKDSWGIPIPHINCSWGENEKAMSKHMANTIEEIIESIGGKALPIADLLNIPFLDSIATQSVALQKKSPPPGYYIHEVGGARMGENQDSSVVDRYNRLWGCDNVLVVDGACWPTSAWQSPTLTMMAITRRACIEVLKQDVG